MTVSQWSQEALEARLVRYADLIPCRTAFIDTRTPGSTEKENFTIIGPGVSENPEQHVHISIPHGFNIGGARQPFACLNSQHSHETAEVFVVHSGRWRLLFGPNCEDGSMEIGPGSVASVPIHMFRGFEKLDQGKGFIFFVLGEDDPGKVTWAPAVFKAAADFGLVLAKGGRLIDTSSGDAELKDVELATGPEEENLAMLRTPPMSELAKCLVTQEQIQPNPASGLTCEGVRESGIIVPQATADGFAPGPIQGWWKHGFNLRQLDLDTGAYVPLHSRREAEVLFIQEGILELSWEGGAMYMGPGDTLTVPVDMPRAFRNTGSVPTKVFVVRGSDSPAPATFLSEPV